MKQTENSLTFFYIKQLLCFYQTCRLQRVIELNGVELSEKDIHDELLSELHDLKNNISLPELTIRQNSSIVDLHDVYGLLLSSRESLNTYHPSLENAVKHTPDIKTLTEDCQKRYEEKGEIYLIRDVVMHIITFADSLFVSLRDFVTNKEAEINFEKAIGYVNLLACVELFFTISEVGKTWFEVTDPLADTEDNPWVD